jgi:hypothetical protein
MPDNCLRFYPFTDWESSGRRNVHRIVQLALPQKL